VQRAERLERERDQEARLAAATERARIAREMHDVIGHSLAVMTTLADGAVAKLGTDPARARSAISTVADLGRQALSDTRRLLGVLRDDADQAALEPQPGLSQLPALADRARATGLVVAMQQDGDLGHLPEATQLTVYRIVQEALTNTLRHAVDPTHVAITVSHHGPSLDIVVADDGRPTPRAARPAAGPGEGQGLIGMRERAAVYSGWVHAGPGEAGGWVVRARLTTEAS
jgi:signal transduction histidine kinase